MSDRVSIIIRSSARAELAQALQSVIDQTYQDIEVVIVNVTGQSHPSLPQQADALTVKFVEPGRQLPRPDAANAGLDAAQGDHLVFLDDDDLLDPGHVGACVAAVRQDRKTLPFTGSQICDENGELQAVWPAFAFGSLEILERIRLQPSAALIPRAVIDKADDRLRFDAELPIFEDWDFWIRVSRRIAFRPLPVNTVIARVGLGTSGTGIGVNFDLQRTARDSLPFHAKWEEERASLAARFDALRDEAEAALESGDLQGAEKACWQAQALKMWDRATLSCLARIFEARNQIDPARRFAAAAERARFLAPGGLSRDALTRLHAHLQAGNAAARTGDVSIAETELQHALALHEGDQTACNSLANLRIAQGRIAEAEMLLQQGMRWGDRTYPSIVLKRGSLLEELGRRNEARTLYEHLARLVPRYAPARDRLQALDAIDSLVPTAANDMSYETTHETTS